MTSPLEKLKIWHKANALWDAVNAMLDRPGFQRDWKLHDQTADAIDSMVANIPEGYEQPTDRGFAKYLYTSKGSAAEAAARVELGRKRNYVTFADSQRVAAMADELIRMTNGLIRHLVKSNRKDRGIRRAHVRVRKRGHRRPGDERSESPGCGERSEPPD